MFALDDHEDTLAMADTAAPDAPTWFEAPSPWGALRLCVLATPQPTRHACDAAILLDGFAPLLDALDDWSGHDAAWRWVAPGACPLSPATHVWIAWQPPHDDALDPIHARSTARLELPWRLLRQLPPPPDELAAQLRWPMLPTVITLSQLRIGCDELQTLEPGGAVLLPESMQPQWHGVLRAAAEAPAARGGVALALASPLAPCIAARTATLPQHIDARNDGALACEVRLAHAPAVSAERLAGWQAGEFGEPGTMSPSASLWSSGAGSETGASARCLAHGRLMPWGDGWALALEAVCERPTKD